MNEAIELKNEKIAGRIEMGTQKTIRMPSNIISHPVSELNNIIQLKQGIFSTGPRSIRYWIKKMKGLFEIRSDRRSH